MKSQNNTSEFGYGSHLYLKGRIFYFRYVLPKQLRAVFGKNEIRLSLNTPYLKDAVLLSQRLFSVLLDYKEGIRLPNRKEPTKQLFAELNNLIENPEIRRVENSEDNTRLRFQSLIEKLQSSTQESSPTTPHGAVGELFASAAVSKTEFVFTMNFGFVLIACIIFFLSYIFSYGQALQQESDETL